MANTNRVTIGSSLAVTRTLRNRTWPVFLVGLGSLLGLLFIPGLTALNRTDEIYREIRAIQLSQAGTQGSLAEVERRMYLISIAVREALLDSGPTAGSHYRRLVLSSRTVMDAELTKLKHQAGSLGSKQFERLESELREYWTTIDPVFSWTPEQRTARATFFLREQQRPRRQSILAIAATISQLIEDSYVKQYEALSASQKHFRGDIERNVALAFFVGTLIAGGSIFRISSLEAKADLQRKETEHAEERLRQLSTQLMNAQEAERKSLSRELHDEVGQMLTGLRMEIGAMDRSRHDQAGFTEHLSSARTLAEQSLKIVRNIAVGLRPSVLDLGLRPALEWQARHFSKLSGIRVNIEIEGALGDLSEQQSICIYRVVQESLTNVAKHSAASLVTILLRASSENIHLTVRDDGRGFVKEVSQAGLGLVGMEERVRELGARLTVTSTPGEGTSLHAVFPSRHRSS